VGSGVPTIFMGLDQGEWVLDWALDVNTLTKPPLVTSISYEYVLIQLFDVCFIFCFDYLII
jgi:hypothetical protein